MDGIAEHPCNVSSPSHASPTFNIFLLPECWLHQDWPIVGAQEIHDGIIEMNEYSEKRWLSETGGGGEGAKLNR